MKQSTKSVVLAAFFANLFIACVKFVVAFFTTSSAMLAEAIHSTADTLNQIFLLVGIRKGRREPDSMHPFGYAGELYFWSFIVAIMLFTLGAVFSIYEGVHKLMHPAPIQHIYFAYLVLFVSIIAEGLAFRKAFKRIKIERKKKSILQYLRDTKRTELIVVFLEDLAALTGLSAAVVLVFVQHVTGIKVFDAIASIVIGLILAAVAFFLGNETKSLLIGESADPGKIKRVRSIIEAEEGVRSLMQIKSLQLGADDFLIAAKIEFAGEMNSTELSRLIDRIEGKIRDELPDAKKIFIEPDIYTREESPPPAPGAADKD